MAGVDFDLYEELEVSPKASPETIEAAYRSLVKRFHPDTATEKRAAEARIKRINVAHDVLSDRAARASYDLSRISSSDRRSGGGPSGSDARDRRGAPPPRSRGSLECPKCGRHFKTPGGLEWHRANFLDCEAHPVTRG